MTTWMVIDWGVRWPILPRYGVVRGDPRHYPLAVAGQVATEHYTQEAAQVEADRLNQEDYPWSVNRGG